MNDRDHALDVVTGMIARMGRMLGTPVRVTLAGSGEQVLGTLSSFDLRQEGGAGKVLVVLPEQGYIQLEITHIEPAGLTGGRDERALPPTGRDTP